mmetsp:Transcript_17966/g.27771  ORF Transcript_17966/g.27771 Transcript_17966/m.27771 type:complete len:99 (+) Transcript_17966:798-1094(+)
MQRELTSDDLQSIRSNKYILQIDRINDQDSLAQKLEVLKLNNMSHTSPTYPLTRFAKSFTAKDSSYKGSALFGSSENNEEVVDKKKMMEETADSYLTS